MTHKRSSQLEPRFVADQMLGRLAKWLRLLGCDVIYSNTLEDDELINIAIREKRTLLTRDTLLLKRRPIKNGIIKAFYIESDDLNEQLTQLLKEGLSLNTDRPYCNECNLRIKPVEKEKIKNEVPPYVFGTQKEFGKCPGCGRVFWRGTHWQKIKEKASRINSKINT